MKISYLIGAVIVVIGIIAFVGFTQSSVNYSENNIRVAFFPSVVHAVPIIGMETQTFANNLNADLDIQVKIFDSGPQVIESIFSNSDSDTLDPKRSLKNFSPGTVSTIFRNDLLIAVAFLRAIRSLFRGLV